MRKLALLLPLLLAACGPSADDLINEYRPQAEPRMAAVAGVAKAAAAHSAELAEPSVQLTFGDGRDAAIVHLELLDEDPKTKPDLDFHIVNFWLEFPRDCLAGRADFDIDADAVRSGFDQLLALKYLVVIRTRLFAAPVSTDDKSFSPGLWQGEVLVYEIEGAKLLGGYSVSAGNDAEVTVNTQSVDSWLRSNLWENARKEVKKVLEKHAKGGVLPL